jgi:uncharacterized glyoxalase superfamily protein PhnB
MRRVPNDEFIERYWRALGKFAHRYAEVEFALNHVLRIAAGVSVKNAQALFSGVRAREAMTFIRRIYESRGEPLDPWLARAFPRLADITTVRDKILHQGFRFKGQRVFASDLHRNMPEKASSLLVSVDDLDALEVDINIIHACLNVYWIEQRWPSKDGLELEETTRHASEPWRYKIPQQGNSRPRRPGKLAKH